MSSAATADLIEIGRNIKRLLDRIPETRMNNIKYVVIENQISPIATRMKTIQGMLAQYFIMRGSPDIVIEFISSKNKLKGFISPTAMSAPITGRTANEQPTDKYKQNKKNAIQYCGMILSQNEKIQKDWGWTMMMPKKDDYADSFLQGYWYLQNKLPSFFTENN